MMLRGRAEILRAGTEHDHAQELLRSRYRQLAAMQIADRPVRSEKCQFRTHAPQQIRPIRHSLPRLSIGCAIPGFDPHRGFESRRHACRRLVERRFLGGEAEPSRVVSPLLTVIARRTVTCCQTTNAGSC